MNENQPIIIAGGGIGGLAAARMLAIKGRQSIVLEQAPEFGEIGAGIQLGPNTHRIFDRLQVTKDMHEIGYFPEHIIMMDSLTGEEVLRLPLLLPRAHAVFLTSERSSVRLQQAKVPPLPHYPPP